MIRNHTWGADRVEFGPEPEGPPVGLPPGIARHQGQGAPPGQSSRLPSMMIMAVDVLRAADAAALDTDGETKH